MKDYDNFSDMQLDVLREIGNIGAGNAATALSSILNDCVSITVPVLQVIDVSEMSTILGGPEKEVAGILVNMTDDIKGMLLFLLDKEAVKSLMSVLVYENIEKCNEISDIGMSALKEIGNILAGSYITSISSMTDLDIRLSTPQIAVDMVGAILSYPAAEFGAMGDKLLFIEEDFVTEDSNTIKSHLLIMPELESLNIILDKLGVE